MRRSAILLALGLACFAGWALAQGVRQYGTDPSGAIGVDTARNIYLNSHFLNNDPRPPVLSTCGSAPAPSVVGNDMVGKVTTGGTATTCTITFAQAYAVAPACVVVAQGSATPPTYTTSTTAITMSVDQATTVYNYFCASTG